ncbi:MAG: ribulose-phosphate 3-epimerase [Microbacteriaceae bacterium]
MTSVRINPSLLSADFGNIAGELQKISHADFVHIDVMDNHFVPNLTMGPVIVRRVQEISPIPLDVHLMVDNPEVWGPVYAEMGAAVVTFHLEASDNPLALIDELHRLGTRVGVGLRPVTPVEDLLELLPHLDQVLIMTVEPGFGGQQFMPETMEKVAWLDKQRQENHYDFWIEVDGGINLETVQIASAHGADTFVAGSSVYGAADPAIMVDELRQLALAARETITE